MKRSILAAGCLGLVVASSCETPTHYAGGGGGDPVGEGDLAEVNLQLTSVPAGLLCMQVRAVVAGQPAVVTNLSVTPGASSATLSLGRLPAGMAMFSGSAFNVACASIGTATALWIADPVSAALMP